MSPEKKSRFVFASDEEAAPKPPAAEGLQRNRIIGISRERHPGNWFSNRRVPLAIVSFLVIASVAGIILITKFYNRPPGFAPQPSPDEKVIYGTDRNELPEGSAENVHLTRGKASYYRGYYADAITEFNEVVESDSSNSDKAVALTFIGIINDEQGRFNQAIEFYERALRYDDRNPIIYRNMSLTYRHLRRFDKAEEAIQRALRIDPRNVNNHILAGNILFEQRKYRDAKASYQEALRIEPSNSSALYNLSMALMKDGDQVSAIEYLKRAADSDRIGKVAHLSYSKLGVMFTQMGDYEVAETYLKKAISVNPTDPIDRYNLGIVNLKKNDKEAALKEFVKAEELGKNDSAMLENLGEAYLSLKEYDKSLGAYNRLLSANQRDSKILSRVAEIYYEKGDLENAYMYFKKITMVQPTSENARVAYLNIGNIMDDAQRYDEAIDSYQKALAINPKDDDALYNLGLSYRNAGRPEKAIESWKSASSLNPQNPRPLLAIADYYYKGGYLDMASDEYQRILRRWPDLQDAHFSLGAIYFRKNLVDYAMGEFAKVVELNERNEMGRKALINLGILTARKAPTSEPALQSALGYVQKALLQKPNDPDALLALGVIYYRKEMHDQAIESFYQVVKATRDSKRLADAYNNMGLAYYKKADYKRALRAFNRGAEEDPSNEEIRINRRTAMQAYESELENR